MDWLEVFAITLTMWGAGFIFLLPLKHRAHWHVRLAVMAAAWLALGFATVYLNRFLEVRAGMLLRLIMDLALMICFFLFCARIQMTAAIYCTVWALLTQQLVHQVWQLMYLAGIFSLIESSALFPLSALLFFTFFYLLGAFTIARFMPEKENYRIGPRQLGSAIFLLAIYEQMLFFMQYRRNSNGDLSEMTIYVLVQIYCITLLYMQNELFKKSAMRQELTTWELLRKQQAGQYSLAKENIALINRKCHDLKHQINALRHLTGEEERESYLSEIENSVQIYEAIVKTGNDVLDTILTEKSLRCRERDISINCVADGRQLDFFDPVDLYTIFGNALDNAVESVEQFDDPQKRQIDVLIYAKQQFLIINIMNPVKEKPHFEDNLPVTTKKDKGYHGYGLKSIRHTVKHYGGFLTVNAADGFFSLKILFPRSSSQ